MTLAPDTVQSIRKFVSAKDTKVTVSKPLASSFHEWDVDEMRG
jgi:hypothetical protein